MVQHELRHVEETQDQSVQAWPLQIARDRYMTRLAFNVAKNYCFVQTLMY